MPNRQALAGLYFLLASHVEIALWLFGSHGSVMAASLRGMCRPGSKLCQMEPFLFSSPRHWCSPGLAADEFGSLPNGGDFDLVGCAIICSTGSHMLASC